VKEAKPSAARASAGWEGGAVGSLIPLAATGGRLSGCDPREEFSAENAFAFASEGRSPRLRRPWVPVRRRSQVPMHRVGTCSAGSTRRWRARRWAAAAQNGRRLLACESGRFGGWRRHRVARAEIRRGGRERCDRRSGVRIGSRADRYVHGSRLSAFPSRALRLSLR
jgi:hypothetical protein